MKSNLFSVLIAVMFLVFTANQGVFAQSKEIKGKDNKTKTTVQKIETKKDEVKQTAGTITHKQHKQTKGGINTVKNEMKKESGKDMKMNNDIKKSDPLTNNKIDKSSDKKIKN